MYNIKRRGERTQPCGVPVEAKKTLERELFTYIVYDELVRKSIDVEVCEESSS